jgi:hypothetical protein
MKYLKTKFKNAPSKFSLLIIVFLNVILSLSATAQNTEQWDIYEIKLKGPEIGNPYIDADLKATFFCEGNETIVNGFYDGNGVYKIRFMPSKTGIWRYTTRSNKPSLDAVTGKFECVKASGTNHVPPRILRSFVNTLLFSHLSKLFYLLL